MYNKYGTIQNKLMVKIKWTPNTLVSNYEKQEKQWD